jgi:hypothetical protein
MPLRDFTFSPCDLGKNVLITALVPNQADRRLVISLSAVRAILLNSPKVVIFGA